MGFANKSVVEVRSPLENRGESVVGLRRTGRRRDVVSPMQLVSARVYITTCIWLATWGSSLSGQLRYRVLTDTLVLTALAYRLLF